MDKLMDEVKALIIKIEDFVSKNKMISALAIALLIAIGVKSWKKK